jgi:hypothetical protein
MNDIKRKVELWLCQALSEALPAQRFVPLKGGSDVEDGTVIEPPYTVIDVREAVKFLQDSSTWTLEVAVTLVTHLQTTTTPEHSRMVRAIYDVIVNLGSGYNVEQELIVHGVDVVTTESVDDETRETHGDVIMCTVGASDADS